MTRIVTLDFETYWSSKDKYSLSKMGPIEYIRDDRFFVQCVAVRVDHGPVEVMDHVHGIDLEKYHLERSDTITVGHNISGFDALVLSEHYGIKPHCCIDTIALCHWLGISRISNVSHKAITQLLGHGTKQAGTAVSDGLRTLDEFDPSEREFFLQYCHDDTLQCSENFFAMYNAMDKGKLDALITMMFTARMATHPAFVPDLGMLYDYVNKLDAGTEAARSKLAEFMHFATAKDMIKAIRSRSEFPKLLEQLGCKCPMKFSEKQGKNIPAISKTDLEFKKLLEHPDERVRTLVGIRLEQNSSIQRSRAVNIINLGQKPIPIPLCAFKAHTGRYTAGSESEVSDGLNFQNLSKRDPNMLTIRKSIKTPKGYKVLACDSSQIEARMLAWVAGQDDLVAQFKSGADPYAEMAAKIFHTDAKAIHDAAKNNDDPNHNKYKMYRNVGKTCILSCLSADTEVMTDTGWKPIITVSETDKLWDGTQWVNHSGLIFNGKKKTINVDGVRMTQDHMVLCGSSWKTASECIETRSFLNLNQALSTGAESSEMLLSTGGLNTFANASIAGKKSKKKSTDCENVYDISNAGENHRFMIRTNSGTMIVHNCGYGVGAQKFSDTLLRSGVKLDDDESKHLDIARMAHRTYRDNSQAIVNLWNICDRVLSDMLFAANRKEIVEGYAFGAHNLLKWGVKYIPCTSILSPYVELPNGYCLWYPNLRSNGDGLVYDRFVHGKITETKIYGGALTENCIQALAFAMLSWQACRVFMCGIPINCNIHDAWIAVVPDADADRCKGIIERYMSSTPMWLSGFPVGCECEVGTDFTIA